MDKTIAVTDLDAMRWYQDSDQSWADFAARLLRRTKAPIAAVIGTDLHSAVQQASTMRSLEESTTLDNMTGRVVNTFDVPKKTELQLLPLRGATMEVPCTYSMPHEGGQLHLRGYIDALDRNDEIWELKSTTRSSNWSERYMKAMQWRVYSLAIDNTRPVHYAVFFLRYDKATVEMTRKVLVTDVAELQVLPYAAMERDVRACARSFARMIDEHLPAYWQRHEEAIKATPLHEILRDPMRFRLD